MTETYVASGSTWRPAVRGVRLQPDHGEGTWRPALAGPFARVRCRNTLKKLLQRINKRAGERIIFDTIHETTTKRICEDVPRNGHRGFLTPKHTLESVPLPQPIAKLFRVMESRVLLRARDESLAVRRLGLPSVTTEIEAEYRSIYPIDAQPPPIVSQTRGSPSGASVPYSGLGPKVFGLADRGVGSIQNGSPAWLACPSVRLRGDSASLGPPGNAGWPKNPPNRTPDFG